MERKGNKNKINKSLYKFVTYVKENHFSPIFDAKFNQFLPNEKIFATVGSNRLTIYKCLEDGNISLLQSYADPDNEENFYCLTWTFDSCSLNSLVITAGSRGIIRVISPSSMDCIKHFKGHGNSINDLKIHPFKPELLLSVSKDHSLRLWNLKTDVCICIFGGVEGHRDEVLAADFHLNGDTIISSGMDHALKIWTMNGEQLQTAIKNSYNLKNNHNGSNVNNGYTNNNHSKPFETFRQHFPIFTTRDAHRNYVDSVQWFGNFVLSKSCENSIICWKPGKLENIDDINLPKNLYNNEQITTIVHKFEYKESEIWFIRFSMDEEQKILAIGNQTGKTYVWEIHNEDPSLSKCSVLSHPKCTSVIRQTCLNNNGDILLSVCDDSTIWRWDRINN